MRPYMPVLPSKRPPIPRDRWFESASLHRRVSREPRAAASPREEKRALLWAPAASLGGNACARSGAPPARLRGEAHIATPWIRRCGDNPSSCEQILCQSSYRPPDCDLNGLVADHVRMKRHCRRDVDPAERVVLPAVPVSNPAPRGAGSGDGQSRLWTQESRDVGEASG